MPFFSVFYVQLLIFQIFYHWRVLSSGILRRVVRRKTSDVSGSSACHLILLWFLAWLNHRPWRCRWRYSETSVDSQQTTRRYILEDRIIHCQRCESLKFIPVSSIPRNVEIEPFIRKVRNSYVTEPGPPFGLGICRAGNFLWRGMKKHAAEQNVDVYLAVVTDKRSAISYGRKYMSFYSRVKMIHLSVQCKCL
jgi:hypothetical protein